MSLKPLNLASLCDLDDLNKIESQIQELKRRILIQNCFLTSRNVMLKSELLFWQVGMVNKTIVTLLLC